MINSVLFRRSSMFCDAINVLLHIDLFFYHELNKRMLENDLLEYLFSDNIPKVSESALDVRDAIIIKSASEKENQNILLDWINPSKYLEYEISLGMSMEEFVANLYYIMLVEPVCDEYIQSTEFGNTVRLLAKDINMGNATVSIPFESSVLRDAIYNLFIGVGTKVDIIIGDKTEFLSKNNFDTFVFENCSDVDNFLRKEHSRLTEILIPSYEFNMVEDRSDLDKLIEQVTFRKLNLIEPLSDYASKYNISINTISVPI